MFVGLVIMFRKMKRTWREFTRPKSYQNYVEALSLIKIVQKLVGVSAYTLNSGPGGKITAHFTYLGFVCSIIWYSIYFSCVYRVFSTDQTILRTLYDTKLKHYGDYVERIATTIFVLYTAWKFPYDTNLNFQYAQQLVNIDKAIENLGEMINFSKCARITLVTASVQIIIALMRILTIWASLLNLNTPLPFEKIFQVVYSDSLALIATAQYCVYLSMLTDRYRILNKILDSIQAPKTREVLVGGRRKVDRGLNVILLEYQDRYVCEKIRSCGKIYGMLHSASVTANSKFGLSITLNMLMCFVLIILYLFYFMEATAAGLFHEFQKYVDFLIYVFWQISFAMGNIFLNIYFCERTVHQAKLTSFVTHKIINSEMSSSVRTEAVHLSLQVIHQVPSFTARGLTKIDYVLLLEGSRTVVTFLIMLLEFAANTH